MDTIAKIKNKIINISKIKVFCDTIGEYNINSDAIYNNNYKQILLFYLYINLYLNLHFVWF